VVEIGSLGISLNKFNHLLEVSRVGGNVDLSLTVGKVHINATVDGLAVSSRVEDVANMGTVLEWLISHSSVLLVGGVGQSN